MTMDVDHFVVGIHDGEILEWDSFDERALAAIVGTVYEEGVTEASLLAAGAMNLSKHPHVNSDNPPKDQ